MWILLSYATHVRGFSSQFGIGFTPGTSPLFVNNVSNNAGHAKLVQHAKTGCDTCSEFTRGAVQFPIAFQQPVMILKGVAVCLDAC